MNFDLFYASKTNYFTQSHSGGLANFLSEKNIEPCKAVDIGAGEGRNSLYLANLGYDVIAIEPSKIGAQKILDASEVYNLDVSIINTDFLTASEGLYRIGLVIAITSLDHMEYSYLCKSIIKIKQMLCIGGYVYITVFTEEDPGYMGVQKDIESECSTFIKHYFHRDELKKFFSDFEILEYSEYVKEDSSHGDLHVHGMAKLVAKKL